MRGAPGTERGAAMIIGFRTALLLALLVSLTSGGGAAPSSRGLPGGMSLTFLGDIGAEDGSFAMTTSAVTVFSDRGISISWPGSKQNEIVDSSSVTFRFDNNAWARSAKAIDKSHARFLDMCDLYDQVDVRGQFPGDGKRLGQDSVKTVHWLKDDLALAVTESPSPKRQLTLREIRVPLPGIQAARQPEEVSALLDAGQAFCGLQVRRNIAFVFTIEMEGRSMHIWAFRHNA